MEDFKINIQNYQEGMTACHRRLDYASKKLTDHHENNEIFWEQKEPATEEVLSENKVGVTDYKGVFMHCIIALQANFVTFEGEKREIDYFCLLVYVIDVVYVFLYQPRDVKNCVTKEIPDVSII